MGRGGGEGRRGRVEGEGDGRGESGGEEGGEGRRTHNDSAQRIPKRVLFYKLTRASRNQASIASRSHGTDCGAGGTGDHDEGFSPTEKNNQKSALEMVWWPSSEKNDKNLHYD